jgi:oligopeptidase A
MKDNPLFFHFGLPLFDQIKPEHIGPAVKETLEILKSKTLALEKSQDTTWDGLFKPLEEISLAFHFLWSPISHLHSVMDSGELRMAYEEAQPKIVAFGLWLSQNEILFSKLKSIKESPLWDELSSARRRAIEDRLQSAKLSGLELQGDQRSRFNSIEEELSKLQMEFANAVLDGTKAFQMVLRQKEEVEGLPVYLLEQYAFAYDPKNLTPTRGPWLVGLDGPSYVPFMENSAREDLRERLYRAYLGRAPENETRILKILALRNEKAKLVGFETYADLSLSQKMAEKKETVYRFLEDLREASWDQALENLADLKGQKADLKNWDIPYYSKRLKEKKFAFKEEDLKPYFALDGVLSGLFLLAKKLFGIDIKQDNQATSRWHPDVRYFQIRDQNSKLIAGFFLDPYARSENKRGGAWMDDCISRHIWKGEVVLPVAYLICNSTPPQGKKPSLMTFGEVETLFHEFGHGLQHMLTQVIDLDVSGIHNVEWDAVELPSQFMENWCYHEPTLMSFARHYETGEALPRELYLKILNSKNHQSGLMMLRQLQFSLLDLTLHDHFDPQISSIFDVQRQVAKTTGLITPISEDRSLCSFSHIFAGGYAAGYYSYKWAEVLSSDVFSAFEEAPEEEIPGIGRKFMDTVLGLGGSVHPREVFKKFRGRDPDIAPFLRHQGLKS